VPEVVSRAFDPFFTTREVGSGTGLGLSIAQAIAHKHDGTLSLQSTPGKGTVVTLELPISA
jgi:two-component system NtrC family sensor kinase